MANGRLPNWDFWRFVPQVKLWEGVALSMNIEPTQVRGGASRQVRAWIHEESDDFTNRLLLATRCLGDRKPLRPISPYYPFEALEVAEVRLADFAAWAKSVGWSIPDELAQLARSDAAPRAITSTWPWGKHETKLLRALSEAAQKFWTNYDASEPDTAPTNEMVANWLRTELGVSERVAEIMAQMLRADGLPPGPRR